MRTVVALALALLFALVGCKSKSREVVVYTSVDQVFSEPVFRAFERETGIKLRAVFDTEETKSTGVVNRLIAEAARPQADVFWSGDPVRPLLLVKKGMVEPYVSPSASGFLLGAETERRMAESAAHMPLRAGVPTPASVRRLSEIRTMAVDYARIASEMERIQPWLRTWAGL